MQVHPDENLRRIRRRALNRAKDVRDQWVAGFRRAGRVGRFIHGYRLHLSWTGDGGIAAIEDPAQAGRLPPMFERSGV